jgi:hypothetical protein
VLRGQHNRSLQPYSRFLDRSRYFFFQVAPQLCSWGWVDPVPDPLLLRNLVAPGIELWPLDHRGGPSVKTHKLKEEWKKELKWLNNLPTLILQRINKSLPQLKDCNTLSIRIFTCMLPIHDESVELHDSFEPSMNSLCTLWFLNTITYILSQWIQVSITSYSSASSQLSFSAESRLWLLYHRKLVHNTSELYWPSNHRLSAKSVPTFADRGCRVVRAFSQTAAATISSK